MQISTSYRLKESSLEGVPVWPLLPTAEKVLCGFLPKVLLARGAILDFGGVVSEGRNVRLVYLTGPRTIGLGKRGSCVHLFPAAERQKVSTDVVSASLSPAAPSGIQGPLAILYDVKSLNPRTLTPCYCAGQKISLVFSVK